MTRVTGSLALYMCLACAILWCGASELYGQDNEDQVGASVADSLQLVFEREVFNYPSFERRNPFRPQTGDDALGPRFEDLVLLGVVIDPDPSRSLAVLGARPPGATSQQAATRTFRLRRGQTVGNARLIDIQRRQVLMEVDDFGARETRSLDLLRQVPSLPAPLPFAPAPDPSTDTAPAMDAPSDGAVDGDPQQDAARPPVPGVRTVPLSGPDLVARGGRA